jgi:hypothetical protein
MNAADRNNEQGFQLDQMRAAKKVHDFGDTESTISLTARV